MGKRRSFRFIPTFSFFYLVFFISRIIAATDTMTQLQSLTENQTLVSKNGVFEFGFFSPGNSKNIYLGTWYKNIPGKIIVWVANRENPITETPFMLAINNIKQNNNNTVLLTQKNSSVLWSITPSRKPQIPVLQLLDSGNLVLREQHDDGNQENYLWQSFDYPCDTLLPGMKLGKNLKTGFETNVTAWKDDSDPSQGTLNWRMDITNWPEPMQRIGSQKQYNSGPWNGIYYLAKPTRKPSPVFDFIYSTSDNGVYFMFQMLNDSMPGRMVLNQTTSKLMHLAWTDGQWKIYGSLPRDFCDWYAACGPNGNCDMNNAPATCDCLRGYRPKSPQEWDANNFGAGCVRDKPLGCQVGGDGFLKYVGIKTPDTENSWLNRSMRLTECRDECLRNCSCTAYTNTDIRGGGSGCAMWFGDLNDLRILPSAGQDLYVRVPASELEETNNGHKVKIRIAVGVAASVICGLLLALYFIFGRGKKVTVKKNAAVGDYFEEEEDEDLELPLFDLSSIASATNNFSILNKLGEGGFGPVYKGTLENGEEIAVKRLSKESGQGLKEFKNEIALIAKLQHRNLVKLHGFCIQNEEKLLVYEYMPNKSLDVFIFDQTQRTLLDWPKRFHIICGIARGLLYLHQDSRLRIIHRDLKAGNVLLDSEMNAKISDFGLARILGGDRSAGTTRRVVGTYGYMAPEYAIDGNFSVKSDVFSFGVLLLEIVSGKKNTGNYQQKESTSLIGYAWTLWIEGRPLELVGDYLKESCNVSEALRCIHISLLCLQQNPDDRPNMSSVVMMLGSEIDLPLPKQPALFVGEYSCEDYSSEFKNDLASVNELSITVLEAR